MGLVIIYRLGGSGILEDHVEKTPCYLQFVHSSSVLMVDTSPTRNVKLKGVGEIIAYKREGTLNKININASRTCNNENTCSYFKRNSLTRGLGCTFNDL